MRELIFKISVEVTRGVSDDEIVDYVVDALENYVPSMSEDFSIFVNEVLIEKGLK